MKYLLLAVLLITIGMASYAMFQIAYAAMAGEHGALPSGEIIRWMMFTFWFLLMMVTDVIVLRNKALKARNILAGLVTIGVLLPAVYMLFVG
ncbi:MAG TPA: hypothetical protein VG603_15710 [Chitinophagales bacterium]|nr:hypothetical protein [Chitinophagales bacterium]